MCTVIYIYIYMCTVCIYIYMDPTKVDFPWLLYELKPKINGFAYGKICRKTRIQTNGRITISCKTMWS